MKQSCQLKDSYTPTNIGGPPNTWLSNVWLLTK